MRLHQNCQHNLLHIRPFLNHLPLLIAHILVEVMLLQR